MKANEPIWPDELLSNPHDAADKPDRVRRIFDLIAPRYDLANTIISFGLSKYARRRLLRHVEQQRSTTRRILDLCCGPATQSKLLAARFPDARIVAADFAINMLTTAQAQHLPANHELVCADAMALPFPDDTFDLVTCSYGLRNLIDLPKGLAEIHRVLTPGGAIAALDFQIPQNRIFKPLFCFYFKHVLPLIGAIVTGQRKADPYKYLTYSVSSWYGRDLLVQLMESAGLHNARAQSVGTDAIILLTGRKSENGERAD